jgi:hypothetical protein
LTRTKGSPAIQTIEVLACEACGVSYERVVVRGRKPKNCPGFAAREGSLEAVAPNAWMIRAHRNQCDHRRQIPQSMPRAGHPTRNAGRPRRLGSRWHMINNNCETRAFFPATITNLVDLRIDEPAPTYR